MNLDSELGNIILQAKSINISFKNKSGIFKAVDNINFSLRKGEVLGIVGESGSGKSVTCLSILQLLHNSPTAIVDGQMLYQSPVLGKIDLFQLSENEIRSIRWNEISLVFQETGSALNPVLTCGQQVLETILHHKKINFKEAKKLTLELFRQVQIQDPEAIYSAYPHQISGGQKQRVMIAMALSCGPSLIIADEPTTALDVTVQASILELFKSIKKEQQASLIFISHDLSVVGEIADRVVVMYKGRIVEEGRVEEIFTSPKHIYTKALLACRPRMGVKQKVLPTIADYIRMRDDSDESSPNQLVSYEKEELALSEPLEGYNVSRKDNADKPREVMLKVQHLKTQFTFSKGIFKRKYIKAVDDISFEVYKGETLGLVGGSGCGKTTLGRSILRLIEPNGGKIFFEGRDVTDFNKQALKRWRKDCQIIFQDPYSSLNPRMTIGEAIMEPLQIHKIDNSTKTYKEMAVEMLQRVNLEAVHFDKFPHEFSGGERQRICIARALILNPKFIICDEPVSSLDVSVQAQILNLINNLKKDFNFTCIFISHNLAVVNFISDRILVMDKGKIVESGEPDEIYKNPKEACTKALINSIPGISLNLHKQGKL